MSCYRPVFSPLPKRKTALGSPSSGFFIRRRARQPLILGKTCRPPGGFARTPLIPAPSDRPAGVNPTETRPARRQHPACRRDERTPGGRLAARILACLFCLGLCLPLCGCMQAENNAIEGLISPSVIGIDTTDRGYRITISALSPSSDLTSNEVINDVYTAEAGTLDEAVNALTGSVNRTIFKGHIRYVLFGKQMSADQIAVCVDYLIRERDISSSCEAYSCDSDGAYDIIRLLCEGNTRSVHENLRALGEDNPYIGSSTPLTVLDLSEFRLTQDQRFYLPCIELVDQHGKAVPQSEKEAASGQQEGQSDGENGGENSASGGSGEKASSGDNRYFLRYTGARLYAGEEPVTIDFRTFRGMNLLLSPTSICHFVVSLPSGKTVGLNATDIQTDREVRIKEGRTEVTIKVRFLSSLTGVSEDTATNDERTLAEISAAQDQLIAEDIENALVLLQEHGFDFIDVKRALLTRYPFSAAVREQADDLFQSAKVKVEVTSVIARD